MSTKVSLTKDEKSDAYLTRTDTGEKVGWSREEIGFLLLEFVKHRVKAELDELKETVNGASTKALCAAVNNWFGIAHKAEKENKDMNLPRSLIKHLQEHDEPPSEWRQRNEAG